MNTVFAEAIPGFNRNEDALVTLEPAFVNTVAFCEFIP